jgi:hypothetical protein
MNFTGVLPTETARAIVSRARRTIMILAEGDKILVAHRRLFERDETRFFVGVVNGYDGGVVKATGHSYVRDMLSGQMVEKADARTKILSLASGTLIVYELPSSVALDALRFVIDGGRMTITDGGKYAMNLGEFTHDGHV